MCVYILEKEMATHSSVLAWRIPGMVEPGGLPSMGSHRVRHDWSDLDILFFPYSFGWSSTFWRHLSLLFSCQVVSDSLRPHELQHTRLPCPSPSPRACSDSCPLSRWCHPTILSSDITFFSCLLSFPVSGSFPMSRFFASCGQSIGALAPALVLPMNMQGWFPLGLIGLISLQSKGLSRVFSNTTVQNYHVFGA